MKIKSLIRRAGGSTVQMGATIYRFTPENDHTCDVEDESHIERFLAVSTFKESKADSSSKAEDGDGEATASQAANEAKVAEAKVEAKTEQKAARKPRQPKAAKAESKTAAA